MTLVNSPTEEQRAVVEHAAGAHAVVLAVAGSGKTTTLVHRVAHLVRERHVPPERILVLMFNALARKQFRAKATALALPVATTKLVHTFHSYAYTTLMRAGHLPPSSDMWIEDKAELQRRCVHAALGELERSGRLGSNEIDAEEAISAIGMWKGALVPPERAGYRGHPLMAEVYATYERLRAEKKGFTFDDFVPMAVDVLTATVAANGRAPHYTHVIVDEYQDVNFGQQVLIETLAGNHAEVMVAGDDDQTIHEWRGARPDYIRRLFPQRFPDRGTRTYTLTNSFRFGPLIAQCADNVIAQNGDRHVKPVIAYQVETHGRVAVFASHSEQSSDVDAMLCAEVELLRAQYRDRGVTDLRNHIVVLGRTYAQMAGLEGEFVRREIPYRVVGKAPFLERHEVVTLLDYVRIARRGASPMDQQLSDALVRIVNMPNRRIPSNDVRQAASLGIRHGWTTGQALAALADERRSALSRDLREKVTELAQRLERLGELASRSDMLADEVLEWLVNAVDFRAHFRGYYGQGEDSLERLATLDAFLNFARRARAPLASFADLVDNIDPTRGVPEEEQIVFTSVYRTKGLEYQHVVIPSCVEGMMPMHASSESPTYDLAAVDAEPVGSSLLENERRLFYVAITRAKEQVLIGTVEAPRQGVQLSSTAPMPSRFLEELRLDGTEVIASGVSRCADQDDVTHYVREAVAAFGADRSLRAAVHNVAERYLPALSFTRAAERMARLLSEAPAAEFRYTREYLQVGAPRTSRTSAPAAHLPPVRRVVGAEAPDANYD